jgi:hypothetical protein
LRFHERAVRGRRRAESLCAPRSADRSGRSERRAARGRRPAATQPFHPTTTDSRGWLRGRTTSRSQGPGGGAEDGLADVGPGVGDSLHSGRGLPTRVSAGMLRGPPLGSLRFVRGRRRRP